MTAITISKELKLYFLGRNGSGHMCGAEILGHSTVLEIRPITSRGNIGRCSIPIPVDQVEELVTALRDAASELKSSPVQTEASGLKSMIARFGIWGEHPDHPRSDWQYLVMNGETQCGYWDHVLEELEFETGVPDAG